MTNIQKATITIICVLLVVIIALLVIVLSESEYISQQIIAPIAYPVLPLIEDTPEQICDKRKIFTEAKQIPYLEGLKYHEVNWEAVVADATYLNWPLRDINIRLRLDAVNSNNFYVNTNIFVPREVGLGLQKESQVLVRAQILNVYYGSSLFNESCVISLRYLEITPISKD